MSYQRVISVVYFSKITSAVIKFTLGGRHMIQNQSKCSEHIFNAQLNDLQYQVEIEDLFLDLKVLLKEYYMVTFTNDGQGLTLNFTNGQKFILSLKAVN